jgi:hypothetical protein
MSAWVPTYGGNELPVLKQLSMLLRLDIEPSPVRDSEWTRVFDHRELLFASDRGKEIRTSLVALWRIALIEEDEEAKEDWAKHAAAWLVRCSR